LTLFFFNIHQSLARASFDLSHLASPIEMITFNITTILAYAAFTSLMAWQRKEAIRSMPPR
jgi:hypothetical protein